LAQILAAVMAVFAVIGALDKIFGNRLKLGDEFEKGIMTLGPLSLSMIGMMTIAPALADLLVPVITPVASLFGFDPSALAGILIANDMGGASLAENIAFDELLGAFHGLCVASMLGATISFTIPVALRSSKKENHNDVLLGLLPTL
jgi:ethanolamine transporter